MHKVVKNCSHLVNQGISSIKSIKKDKQEYKEYLKRIDTLPDDYKFTFNKITKYMWSFSGGGDGYDMISLQLDLLELFETGVADGKNVLDITGTDVATFCDEILVNAKTYTENLKKNLNNDILNELTSDKYKKN